MGKNQVCEDLSKYSQDKGTASQEASSRRVSLHIPHLAQHSRCLVGVCCNEISEQN